ncbi:MAG TPA: hypothetical protein VFY89_08910 [Ktedonobacterales bacterium]
MSATEFDYAAALRSRAEQGSYLPPLRTIYAGRPGVAKTCAVEWQAADGRWHELDASVPVAELAELWDELRWHAYTRSSERPHSDLEG